MADPDFGTDVSCTDSLQTGVLVSGAKLVAQSMYRRFSTPKGMLDGGDEERDFGFDLADACGKVSTPAEEAALPSQIEAEALKDERVESADVTVDSTTDGVATSWTIGIVGTTSLGPFELTLGVSDVTVQLLGLQASG